MLAVPEVPAPGSPQGHDLLLRYGDLADSLGRMIHLADYERLGWNDSQMMARLEGIEDALTDLFERAEREDITTAAAADRYALGRLDRGSPSALGDESPRRAKSSKERR